MYISGCFQEVTEQCQYFYEDIEVFVSLQNTKILFDDSLKVS